MRLLRINLRQIRQCPAVILNSHHTSDAVRGLGPRSSGADDRRDGQSIDLPNEIINLAFRKVPEGPWGGRLSKVGTHAGFLRRALEKSFSFLILTKNVSWAQLTLL